MNCTDLLRNLISIRAQIPHCLNKYRTIAGTDAKASAQELWRGSSGGRGSSCAMPADVTATKRPAENALSVVKS
jgi:hypothetical protein